MSIVISLCASFVFLTIAAAYYRFPSLSHATSATRFGSINPSSVRLVNVTLCLIGFIGCFAFCLYEIALALT